jgi:putative nucleotidyltransferase with HDIG domain
MRNLPVRARALLGAVVLAAAGVATWTVARDAHFALPAAIVFGFLFLLAELFPVNFARGGYSVSFVVSIAAVVAVGPGGAAVAAAFGGFALRGTERQRLLARFLFNGSNFALSIALAGRVYTALGGPVGDDLTQSFAGSLLPATVATAVNFLVNTSIVAIMIALADRAREDRPRGALEDMEPSATRIWRTQFAPLAPSSFAYALLGLLLGVLYRLIGPASVLFLLVPLLVARGAFQASVNMQEAYDATVESLITAIEAKDAYTRGHAERVARLTERTAREMGLNREQIRVIRYVALMHDIGKLGVETKVLAKPGKLTPEEYEHMKIHPVRGYEIVREIDFLKEAAETAVRHHHERMDGSGYPDGLAGDQIPLFARIVMVCDAFDSMTSTRVYRMAKNIEEAFAEIHRCEGTQFDSECFAALRRAIEKYGWEPKPEARQEEPHAQALSI